MISLFSCKKGDNDQLDLIKDTIITSVEVEKDKTISQLWNALIFEKSSCLLGTGYYKENGMPEEYDQATFKDEGWIALASKDKKSLTKFLLSKLSDTTLTNVHNCPNLMATQGEMSVYALQNLHQKNWWDYEAFTNYKDKKTADAQDHPQIWLQNLLSNKLQREQLAALYKNELDY